MSVVVWDGHALAADRQGVLYGRRFSLSKMAVGALEGRRGVCAWVGEASQGQELSRWLFDGAHKEDWPETQSDPDRFARLIVADETGCWFYERTPHRILVADPYMAWGSGSDIAIGALAMGADAKRAVEVAIQWSSECGFDAEVHAVRPLEESSTLDILSSPLPLHWRSSAPFDTRFVVPAGAVIQNSSVGDKGCDERFEAEARFISENAGPFCKVTRPADGQ